MHVAIGNIYRYYKVLINVLPHCYAGRHSVKTEESFFHISISVVPQAKPLSVLFWVSMTVEIFLVVLICFMYTIQSHLIIVMKFHSFYVVTFRHISRSSALSSQIPQSSFFPQSQIEIITIQIYNIQVHQELFNE